MGKSYLEELLQEFEGEELEEELLRQGFRKKGMGEIYQTLFMVGKEIPVEILDDRYLILWQTVELRNEDTGQEWYHIYLKEIDIEEGKERRIGAKSWMYGSFTPLLPYYNGKEYFLVGERIRGAPAPEWIRRYLTVYVGNGEGISGTYSKRVTARDSMREKVVLLPSTQRIVAMTDQELEGKEVRAAVFNASPAGSGNGRFEEEVIENMGYIMGLKVVPKRGQNGSESLEGIAVLNHRKHLRPQGWYLGLYQTSKDRVFGDLVLKKKVMDGDARLVSFNYHQDFCGDEGFLVADFTDASIIVHGPKFEDITSVYIPDTAINNVVKDGVILAVIAYDGRVWKYIGNSLRYRNWLRDSRGKRVEGVLTSWRCNQEVFAVVWTKEGLELNSYFPVEGTTPSEVHLGFPKGKLFGILIRGNRWYFVEKVGKKYLAFKFEP